MHESCALTVFLPPAQANDAAVQAVVGGLLQAGLQQGTIVVDHSTVLPETTEALAQAVQQQGGQYVAAPVWGRWDALGICMGWDVQKTLNVGLYALCPLFCFMLHPRRT